MTHARAALAALALFPVALLLPTQAAAQEPAPAGLGTVRGVVWDSLAARPLGGARVWTADGARVTQADSAGRFTLDSVAATDGTVGLLAEHPAADSVGVPTMVAAVRLGADLTAEAVIALPSYATLRAAACRDIPDAGSDDGGVLLGAIRNAATGLPIAGAVVSLAWVQVTEPDGRRVRDLDALAQLHGLDAVTDGTGVFYACGLPTDAELAVQASAVLAAGDSATSGELTLEIGPRRVRRHDLMVGRDSGAVARVRVLGAGAEPAAGARVQADEGAPAVTGADGWATLAGLRSGTRVVTARLLGYVPVQGGVDLADGDTAQLVLRLDRTVAELEAVRVSARSVRRLQEVEERERSGLATVLSGEALERSATLASAFAQVPRVRVEGHGSASMNLMVRDRFAGWCAMPVYIDGRRTVIEELLLFSPDELLAIEVYPRGGQAPAQYVWPQDMGSCGIVLVWLR